jgi:CPA1 family monovalent cation:H+ antiporter
MHDERACACPSIARVSGTSIFQAVEAFVALLVILAFVALLTRRVGLPYTVALVLFGVAISTVSPPVHLQVSPELVLVVLLPGLVFEAAYSLDERELIRALAGVLLLAVPGVLVVAAFVGLVLHVATGMALGPAFVVGAMVSATDPAAVTSSIRRLKAPARLATMVEAESLLNDGTGIVVFTIAVAATIGTVDPAHGVIEFVGVTLGSVVVGVVCGIVISRVAATVDDHLVELTLTLLAAYGTYLVADRLGMSGIIATVVSGVVLGSYGRQVGLSARVQDAIDVVWEFFAFLLTALVFLLIGLSIPLSQLAESLVPIAWGVAAILVGRAAVVYLMLGGASALAERLTGRERVPLAWLHVMFWAGLRGAVAVALALALPSDFPDRELVQGITFGIVLFTLLVQGTSAERVINWSGARDAIATPADGVRSLGKAPLPPQ